MKNESTRKTFDHVTNFSYIEISLVDIIIIRKILCSKFIILYPFEEGFGRATNILNVGG